ncbi:MAG: BPTI/Kunitz domain-containing protein [Candidatus Marinimicrobia bacterium]|nr:BPTI/Kunitz domain-containing protein [Candidatus Neomarinimicrobiota bacterium]
MSFIPTPNKANQLGLPKAAPLRSASLGIRLFATLGFNMNNLKSILLTIILSLFGFISFCCKDNSDSINNEIQDTTFVYFNEVQNSVYQALRVGRQGYFYYSSNDEWLDFCGKYRAPSTVSCQQLEFTDSILVGVTWNETSGCDDYSESIKSVFIFNDTLHIVFDFYLGEPCYAQIYPIHLVKIYDHDLPIKFNPPYSSYINYLKYSENCFQEPEYGKCDSSIVKYYYDLNDHECKEFEWSGCGGYVPFATYEECDTACNE